MRDLQHDLDICNRAGSSKCDSIEHALAFANIAYDGWPHAIHRAIKAEKQLKEIRRFAINSDNRKNNYTCKQLDTIVDMIDIAR